MNEQHLIIDWINRIPEKGMKIYIKERKLKLDKIIYMEPLTNKGDVISRFYNQNVNDFRGATKFTIYKIIDENPIYDYRNTTKGNRKVNSKMFDFKKFLRTPGSYDIHTTDNIQETKDNLKVLELYKEHYNQRTFNNIRDVFDLLNSIKNLNYVVLRNFEGYPDEISIDEHFDVDLLVSDYYLAKAVLDADSVQTENRYEDGSFRILNQVIINEQKVWFDLRFIGDDYYDINFEKEILANKIEDKNFFIPNKDNHLYSLLYHALIHKNNVANNYKTIFEENNLIDYKEALIHYMTYKGFKFVKPMDQSVGYNTILEKNKQENWLSFIKNEITVIKKIFKKTYIINNTFSGIIYIYPEKKIRKVFRPFDEIRKLIKKREEYWLKKLEKLSFTPKILKITKESITMTYCGERVTKTTMPSDYKTQIRTMLQGLKKYNCSHNDIKPAELLVRNNKLFLIDFGWATEINEEIPSYFPESIGEEFIKGIFDFDDEYSLSKSINKIMNEKNL